MVQSEGRRGNLEVICGGMFSGKTEELIRRITALRYAKRNIGIYIPALDTRYKAQTVVSHRGSKLDAIPVRTIQDILENVDKDPEIEVVAVDEVQFLESSPEEIVEGFQKLAKEQKRVIVVGLDLDFRAKPFPPMPDLMAVSEYVEKLLAICPICGNPAGFSQRLINGKPAPFDEPTISLGGIEQYEPRCREHYKLP